MVELPRAIAFLLEIVVIKGICIGEIKMNSYPVIKGKNIGEGKPKICVPLMGADDETLLKKAAFICEAAKTTTIDIVEFRADYYKKLNDFSALKEILCKLREKLEAFILLFTIRSEREGGEKLLFSTPSVNEVNRFVIENRLADIVDIELFSGDEVSSLVSLAKENSVKIIMSNHDFKTTPCLDEIINRLVRMQTLGADIAKIAVMPEDEGMLIRLLEATTIMKREHNETPVVAIAMGGLGAVSRMAGQVFGSAISFATVGEASAPGQLKASDLNAVLDIIDKYCRI